jgi:hypothetical protein
MQFSVSDIMPQREAVLHSQGFREGVTVKKRIQDLITEALEIFSQCAQPLSLSSEVSIKEFEDIFRGAGKNAPDTPLQQIFPRADRLALYALTMGGTVSAKINECFSKNNFALGSILDSVASLAAENAVEVCEGYFFNTLSHKKNSLPQKYVLSYSPGYCGWHISGQEKFFQFLQPERIGIFLNDSFLMNPLKSVSGVMVGGNKEIHIFKSNFPFCSYCKHHTCRERMKKLKSE